MNKKQKQQFCDLFAESFHDVVLPTLEDMDENIHAVRDDLVRIDRTLVRIEDRLDRHGSELDRHEKQLSHLKLKPSLAS